MNKDKIECSFAGGKREIPFLKNIEPVNNKINKIENYSFYKVK